jgi:bifunctional N-acetylglucosamine-1-phosphate-uridyltransferase/glucosamine-1-phosphate-acetyltransferase GlmU-like protein
MNQNNFIKVGDCKISTSATIHSGSVIGKKFRRFLDNDLEDGFETIILDNVFIGYNCIIGNGSEIGKDCILDDKSVLESRVILGIKNLIIYGSQICSDVIVGDNCVIGGFIGERTKIGNNCRIFGSIVHSQYEPLNNWDAEDSMEDAPIILDNVFIGFKAIISAPVRIGPKSYVCAGSIVSKDVPPEYIAHGINKQTHFSKWKGALKNSNLFK